MQIFPISEVFVSAKYMRHEVLWLGAVLLFQSHGTVGNDELVSFCSFYLFVISLSLFVSFLFECCSFSFLGSQFHFIFSSESMVYRDDASCLGGASPAYPL